MNCVVCGNKRKDRLKVSALMMEGNDDDEINGAINCLRRLYYSGITILFIFNYNTIQKYDRI